MRYKIQTGPDGVAWVTIQPLIEDCREILDNAIGIDTDTMTEAEKMGHNAAIVSIKSVLEFLNSLMLEHNLNNVKEENNENTTRSSIH
jgi:hypothetical protein